MTLDDVITQSRAAAEANDDWLGSDEQLELLSEFAQARGCTEQLQWSNEPGRSYSQAGSIGLQRVRPAQVDDPAATAEDQALTVWHETMHILYSDDRNAAGFTAWVDQLQRAGATWIATLTPKLFNALEDARIAYQERVANPQHGPWLDEFHTRTMARKEDSYRQKAGEPWIANPVSTAAQLHLALLDRVYVGDRDALLHPLVSELVSDAAPIIERAQAGGDTDAARDGAIDLARLIGARQSELT